MSTTANLNSHAKDFFDAAIETTEARDRIGGYCYPTVVSRPRIKLKAIRRSTAGSDRSDVSPRPFVASSESRGKPVSSKIQIHELVGEAYTVLSLAGIIGLLIYHIAG